MENIIKDSDRDYLVLRGRRVPRRQPEYVDAESERGTPSGRVAGCAEKSEDNRLVAGRSAANKGGEREISEDDEEEAKMTYREFVHDLQQRTNAMIVQSMQDMCRIIGESFRTRTRERDELLDLLMEIAMEREKRMGELECENNECRSQQQAGRFKEPMPFSGANPREWLMQMRQYYDLRGFEEDLRLKDVPFHLRGDAHLFYYTLAQHYPERLPRTWKEFEHLLTQRFCSRTPVETLQRLMQIKYRDSVSDVTTQFARVCAEGDPLPQDKLIHVYLSRFPKAMVDEAMKVDFSTWVEASEYLQRQNRELTMKLAEWYQLAPPEFKREVEMDKQCMREGWILKNPANSSFKTLPNTMPGAGGKGAETNKMVPGVARNAPDREKTKFNKFLEILVCHLCKGKGHRAKECPSRDPAAQRDGSKCRKCGGLGHWARSCPSPGHISNFQRGALPAAQPMAPKKEADEGGNGQA